MKPTLSGLPHFDPLADALGLGVLASAWQVGEGASQPDEVGEALDWNKYRVDSSVSSGVKLVFDGRNMV
jgi:hypothetical protein